MTLLELLMIMVVLGILLALATPNVQALLASYRLKGAARDLKSSLYLCKLRAVRDNCNWVVQIEANGYTMFSDNGRTGLGPDNVWGTEDDVVNTALRNNGQLDGGAPGEASTMEAVDLGSYPGVTFGDAGHGVVADGDVGNGAAFAGGRAILQPNGRPLQLGTIYLQNNRGQAYAVSVNIAGNVRMWIWEGIQWQAAQ